jgi:hypothetical protein
MARGHQRTLQEEINVELPGGAEQEPAHVVGGAVQE